MHVYLGLLVCVCSSGRFWLELDSLMQESCCELECFIVSCQSHLSVSSLHGVNTVVRFRVVCGGTRNDTQMTLHFVPCHYMAIQILSSFSAHTVGARSGNTY